MKNDASSKKGAGLWTGVAIGVGGVMLLVGLYGWSAYTDYVDNAQGLSRPAPPVAAPEPAQATQQWNTADPDPFTNGNLQTAAAALQSGVALPSATVDAATALKAPWRFYGQRLCFSGVAASVTDYPPGGNVSNVLGGGEASEVVMQTPDGTVVDLISPLPSGSTRTGDPVTVCGLVAGRAEVPNALGGTFQHLAIVGAVQ